MIGKAVPRAAAEHARVFEVEPAVVDPVEWKERTTHRPSTAFADGLVSERVVGTEGTQQVLLEGAVPVIEITGDQEGLVSTHLGAQEFSKHLRL